MSDQVGEHVEASEVRPQAEQPVPAYSWYALGVLVLIYVLNFIDRQILSILANDIKADLGVDDAYLGFLYGTAFAIFYALFGIPLGRLADSPTLQRRGSSCVIGLSAQDVRQHHRVVSASVSSGASAWAAGRPFL